VADWLDAIRSHVLALPDLAKFAVIIAAIVGVPRLAVRIGVPPMVGLLLFGVALGPHVLGFFGEHRPIADFFAELGKLLLMFSAGLDIDIALFRRAQTRSIIFGLFTTSVPLLFGTLLASVLAMRSFRRSSSDRCWHPTRCSAFQSSNGWVSFGSNRSSSRSAQPSFRTRFR
jgi:Sodium/hydrogen exchanger family